jgi:hypothetical protein
MLQKLRNAQIAAFVAIATLPGLALAQGTDPFTTAIDTATDKVTDYAGALVVLGAVAVVFMIALKYVKKIVKAA